ncbi:MAG: hypothetical protein ACRD2X_14465 [Vicinamibacteraceae bacterium]
MSNVAVAVRQSSATRWWHRHAFYVGLPVAMTIAVFVGFAPTYYLKTAYGTPELAPLYHVHGLLFTCWMLLLISQPALVAARRTDLHRRIGRGGVVLAAMMMVAAFAVTLDLGRRGAAPPGVPPLMFLIVPFSTLIVFPALIGAAFAWRRTPETHKRLMLIGTLELVPAGFGRWPLLAPYGPLAYFGMTDVFLLAILVYDRVTRGRFHPATLWGGGFLVLSQVLRIVLGGTETWQRFARWFVS